MYQHWQMTLPLLLSVYYRYYRSGPSCTGYRNIWTSEDVLLHRYGLFRFDGGSQGSLGSPVGFVGWDPSRNPQMMGVAQREKLKFLKMSFWRII